MVCRSMSMRHIILTLSCVDIFCAHHMHFLFLTHFLLIIGAMKDNIDVLQKGVLVLLPEPDDRGRAIIYFNPSLKRGDDDTADKVFNIVFLFYILLQLSIKRPCVFPSVPKSQDY